MAKNIPSEPAIAPSRGSRSSITAWLTLLLVLALVGAALSLLLYNNSQKELSAANAKMSDLQKQIDNYQKDPNAAAQSQNKQLIEKVGQLIVLPSGEEPTIATVTDPSKLQDQQFFVNTQLGDKVLIYTNAKKAILYRPSENKVIEVAPLNIGSQTSAGTNTNSNSSSTKTKASTDSNSNQ